MAQTLEHNEAITQVVPITVPSCDVDVTVIQQLDDEPNDVGGLSATELKAKFDETNAAVKDYINDELIPAVVGADATEQARQAAEAERVANEIERVSNESARASAETGRTSAESGRVSAESARASAESGRVSAEQQRQQNETARQDLETGYVAQAAGSASAAAASAQNAAGSATNAQSWAVGGTGTRSGEDLNNSKYWCQQAQQAAGGGVTSFNGRSGVVTPQSGDYDASMVGARPDTWMPTAAEVGADASGTASSAVSSHNSSGSAHSSLFANKVSKDSGSSSFTMGRDAGGIYVDY